MTTIEILPFILFIVVIVTAVSERINVPYPLLLVIAGLIVGFIPGIPNWHPDSDIVLAIFLPPILFRAARLISNRDILNNLGTIGWLSIVLVLITAFMVAMVVHHFIPKVSFANALVLGAIIAPTDTVAASAILSRMNVRENIIRTIEVESLFNDAISIVLYKSAIVYVAFGTLQVGELATHSLLMGLGGIIVGLIFAFFTSLIVEQFLKYSENELPIIMSLILAYVAYLFAERIGVSGVLAVVTAGLFHKRTERQIEARTRLSETSVWETLIFFLNGIIFTTIGIQFPSFLNRVSYIPPAHLVWFSTITILSLLLLRLIWVAITTTMQAFFARFRKGADKKFSFSWRRVITIAWSGMRGLVSLALAIAIPIAMHNGQSFPYRNLIIFLTIITILFTLIVQGLSLPTVIKWLGVGKDDKAEQKKIEKIYQKITEQAIKHMKQDSSREGYSTRALKRVEKYYSNRVVQTSDAEESPAEAQALRYESEDLLSNILKYEREQLASLRKRGEISEEIFIKIIRKIDRDEMGFASYR